MGSPVKLYQQEMHNNLGFFATWLPVSILNLGDYGVLENGRFRKAGTLKELGIAHSEESEGAPQDMSYSASAQRRAVASAGAGTAVPIAKAELSIRFDQQGGYVFEALGMRHVEIADRMALADRILRVYEEGGWRKEWLVVDALYKAASATIIVSEDSSSEIVFSASGQIPLGSLPLADPKIGLSVYSSSGKIVHWVAKSDLSPLYSCLKVDSSWFGRGTPTMAPVRGMGEGQPLTRLGIKELLDS